MQGRWSTVGSTVRLFRLFPVYIKHSLFPFQLYHRRKQRLSLYSKAWWFLLVQIILKISLFCTCILSLVKCQFFPVQSTMFIYVHFWGMVKRGGDSKKEAFPSPSFFLPLTLNVERTEQKPFAFSIHQLNWANTIAQTPRYISLSGMHLSHHQGNSRAARKTVRVLAKHCYHLKLMDVGSKLCCFMDCNIKGRTQYFRLTNKEDANTIFLPNLIKKIIILA